MSIPLTVSEEIAAQNFKKSTISHFWPFAATKNTKIDQFFCYRSIWLRTISKKPKIQMLGLDFDVVSNNVSCEKPVLIRQTSTPIMLKVRRRLRTSPGRGTVGQDKKEGTCAGGVRDLDAIWGGPTPFITLSAPESPAGCLFLEVLSPDEVIGSSEALYQRYRGLLICTIKGKLGR